MPVIYGAGYSFVGYSRDRRKHTVEALVAHLPTLLNEVGADCVVVRGTSGVFIAGAIALVNPDIPFVIARKPGETSHSGMWSACKVDKGGSGLSAHRMLFLDDLIDTGDTLRGVKADAEELGCTVVACLTYGGAGPNPPVRRYRDCAGVACWHYAD